MLIIKLITTYLGFTYYISRCIFRIANSFDRSFPVVVRLSDKIFLSGVQVVTGTFAKNINTLMYGKKSISEKDNESTAVFDT